MYFGTSVIGERLVRKIQLINKGALGTDFRLEPVASTPRGLGAREVLGGDQSSVEAGSSIGDLVKDDNASEDLEHEHEHKAIETGQVKEGFIGPFATVDLEFIFAPTYPGKFEEKFAIKFDDQNSAEVRSSAALCCVGTAV